MPIVFFGDEIADLTENLRKIRQNIDSTVVLKAFLEKATTLLQEEIRAQPREFRYMVPSFTSVFDLAEHHNASEVPNRAIGSALTFVCHLANFIGYYEQQPEQYLKPQDGCVLGLGVGLLSAAAVACSRTLVDLPLIALKLVPVAFRTGAVVKRILHHVHQSGEAAGDLSMVISNASEATVQAELDTFQESMVRILQFLIWVMQADSVKNVPKSERAYIGIVYHGGCVVSGQRSVLNRIMRGSSFFHDARIQESPLCRLNSAVLVYGDIEIQEIMGRIFQGDNQMLPPCRHVLSPIDGKELSTSSAYDLFERSVDRILQQPVRWNALLQSTVDKVEKMDGFENRVLASGSTKAAESLSRALRSGLDRDSKVESLEDWCSSAHIPWVSRGNDSTVVVVGMSGRYLGVTDADGLQQDFRGSLDADSWRHFKTRFAMGQEEVGINNASFGCCVEESDMLDPRLAITTAYEALEMSGFVPNRTPSTHLDRVGTFYSQSSDDWRELDTTNMKVDFNPVGPRAFTPGRVSHYFNFGGPSHSVDTACSSSLAAIHTACKSLRSRECDTAVVGGLDVSNAPDISANFSLDQDLCKMGIGVSGPTKSWGSMASGYSQAYVFGSIVMKRLQDAKADNDNILGAILGSATNHSGDAISAMRPHAGNQLHLHRNILHSAGIDAAEVSHIETHGTTTPCENLTGIGSGTEALTPKNQKSHERLPLRLGTTNNSSLGHIETAAGVTALIKILLKLRKHQFSDHIGTQTSFSASGVSLSKTSKPSIGSGPALAFLNRVSVARGNTTLLLQGGIERSIPLEADPRSLHTVAISANSVSSLKRNIKLMEFYAKENPNVSLPSLAYTTTARHVHHRYRVAVSVSSIADLQGGLQTALEPGQIISPRLNPPKVAFIFTGQGAYYPRIGRQLYELSSKFRADVKYMNSLTVRQGLPSFLPAIDGSIEEGSHLSPLVQQLATCCVQMGLVKLWQSWGIKPSVVMGQSLGEYAALNAAGVISVDHTIHLVGQRGRILQSRCRAGTHGMVAVKSSVATIQKIANGRHFEVECLNSARDTIIGGTRDEVDDIVLLLTDSGQKCKKLNLPFAFHSTQVEPVLDPFETVADGVVFEAPKIPVISTLLGEVISRSGVFNANYCRRHTREPVNLLGAVQAAQHKGILDTNTICIELGPHPVCSPSIVSTLGTGNIMAASLRKSEDAWQTICASLGVLHCNGLEIDWNEVHRDYASSHQLLDLPSCNFEIGDSDIDYPIHSSGSSTSSFDSSSSGYNEGYSSSDSGIWDDSTLSEEELVMK